MDSVEERGALVEGEGDWSRLTFPRAASPSLEEGEPAGKPPVEGEGGDGPLLPWRRLTFPGAPRLPWRQENPPTSRLRLWASPYPASPSLAPPPALPSLASPNPASPSLAGRGGEPAGKPPQALGVALSRLAFPSVAQSRLAFPGVALDVGKGKENPLASRPQALGGMMGSLRVIELQLVAFIVVFSASGLIPILDLAFPIVATLYIVASPSLALPPRGDELFRGGGVF